MWCYKGNLKGAEPAGEVLWILTKPRNEIISGPAVDFTGDQRCPGITLHKFKSPSPVPSREEMGRGKAGRILAGNLSLSDLIIS